MYGAIRCFEKNYHNKRSIYVKAVMAIIFCAAMLGMNHDAFAQCGCDTTTYTNAYIAYDASSGGYCIWFNVNFTIGNCPINNIHFDVEINSACDIADSTPVFGNASPYDTVGRIGHHGTPSHPFIQFTVPNDSGIQPCSSWDLGFRICPVDLSSCLGTSFTLHWNSTDTPHCAHPNCSDTGGFSVDLGCPTCGTIHIIGDTTDNSMNIHPTGRGALIDYIATTSGTVKEEIYSIDGALQDIHVFPVVKGQRLFFDFATHEASGTYICRITQGNAIITKKFTMTH
jgi:hypothetical protein